MPFSTKPKLIKSPDTLRKDRIPPGQKVIESWRVLHYGDIPGIDIARWTFKINGLVEEPKELGFEEFMALPVVEVLSDIHCVTGWTAKDNLWEGISSSAIKELVTIKPEARYVIIRGAGDFTTNLPIDEFFAGDALFAIKHNGRELTPEHGWPLRLVVPHLYFWKSAKWVRGVLFSKEDVPGFWESHGYHNHGDPWKEERFGRRGQNGES